MGGWTIPESTEITEEHKKIYNNAISKYDGTAEAMSPSHSSQHRSLQEQITASTASQPRNPATDLSKA